MDKVIVTGATGFLGLNLSKRLKSMGFEVIGLGRDIKRGEKLKELDIKFISVDLSDSEKLNEVFNGAKYVFHCAAKSSVWGNYKSFYEANVIGTQNVCSACINNNVERLIYVSTPSIYFDFKDKLNIKEAETLPEKFANNYAKTKYLAENVVDKAVKNGLNVITIRPRAILGIGDTAIIPRIINKHSILVNIYLIYSIKE